ncbi:hypothetical protein RhiXN_08065 [Rhizoctonia solani]|uniref:Uncharacterized protein n=1 Tax=Rhizoctonia solani TaxID=456999 RepID=A0A8H8P006_9AGAM|nr:uncharacterized protein RhiXN_08065 [Rhizoctonia solani]QRW23029.1 hypothetical protein RhiXN_08065 [Rhizoctonia solani]
MIINSVAYSAMIGGAEAPQSMAFEDAANDLNALHSITKIEFNAGWVVDGIRVTYSTEQGLERKVVHGTFKESNIQNQVVAIAGIAAMGLHGHPNGRYDYGDCVQTIRFGITNSKTGKERYTANFGAAEQLQNPQEFKWEGRLSCFAGVADNSLVQVGLKGLKFGQITGKVVLAESIPYGGGRSSKLMGKEYNDLHSFGAELDFWKPIKSIEIWSGQVVDGLLVTYNMLDGSTQDVMHGATGGTKTKIDLSRESSLGADAVLTDQTRQIQRQSALLRLTGSTALHPLLPTGALRFSFEPSGSTILPLTFIALRVPAILASFGIPNQHDFVQETRKDLCVRGPLVGFAGVANNSANQVGLNTTIFYTVVNVWQGVAPQKGGSSTSVELVVESPPSLLESPLSLAEGPLQHILGGLGHRH